MHKNSPIVSASSAEKSPLPRMHNAGEMAAQTRAGQAATADPLPLLFPGICRPLYLRHPPRPFNVANIPLVAGGPRYFTSPLYFSYLGRFNYASRASVPSVTGSKSVSPRPRRTPKNGLYFSIGWACMFEVEYECELRPLWLAAGIIEGLQVERVHILSYKKTFIRDAHVDMLRSKKRKLS